MASPKIRINFASTDEIARLYGIGPERARVIVARRTTHGPFRCIDDLVGVGRITRRHAEALAPHIDWSLPEVPEPLKAREWVDALVWLMLAIMMMITLVGALAIILMNTQLDLLLSERGAWATITVISAGAGTLACFMVFGLARSGQHIIRNRSRARRLAQVGLLGLGASLVSATLFALSIVVSIQFYDPLGASRFQSDQSKWVIVVGLVGLGFLILLIVPRLLVFWRPSLVESKWLANCFDAGVVLFSLALIAGIRFSVGVLPIGLLIVISIIAAVTLAVSLLALRRGESFFQASLDFLDMNAIRLQKEQAGDWLTWIDSYLPDKEAQRALWQALDDRYQPTKRQRLFRYLVVSILGWLTLEAAGSVVQWFIQGWLDRWWL